MRLSDAALFVYKTRVSSASVTIVGFREDSTEFPDSMKSGEYLYQLANCQLLKKIYAARRCMFEIRSDFPKISLFIS
jgi:TolA-binding protein